MVKKQLWKMKGGFDLKKEFGEIKSISYIDSPTAKKNADYSKIFPLKNSTRELVINAIITDPFGISLKSLLLAGRLDCFIRWLIWLGDQHRVRTHIVMDKKCKYIISLIDKKTRQHAIHIYPVSAKYPQDHPEIALKTVFGKYACDCRCKEIEIVHIKDIIRAFYKNKALIGKTKNDIISITLWDDISNRWIKTVRQGEQKVGVLSDYVLNALVNYAQTHNYRFISGGLMTGKEIAPDDFDITRVTQKMSPIVIIPKGDTRDFLPNFTKHLSSCATTNLYGEERECVNCGWCDDICPLGLNVKSIYESICEERFKEAERLGLFECIDCGLCSYKCPAKIDILETIKKTKKTLRKGGENSA